jgi:hypothetical protein
MPTPFRKVGSRQRRLKMSLLLDALSRTKSLV